MASRYELSTYIDITVASQMAHVSPSTVRRYIRRGLISGVLTSEELVKLRRVRRLTGLGVNLAGIEIILRMRRQIEELQAEIDRLQSMVPGDTGCSGSAEGDLR
jgi:MerR family transcriptional regulator/heat shock protein HspR